MKKTVIQTPHIKLDSFLKFSGVCSEGSEAKTLVLQGKVTVNGTACLMRGKKLISGDVVEVNNESYKVCQE